MGVKDVDGWALRDQMIAPFFSDYMHIVFGLLFSKTKKEKKKVVMHGVWKLQKKSYFHVYIWVE